MVLSFFLSLARSWRISLELLRPAQFELVVLISGKALVSGLTEVVRYAWWLLVGVCAGVYMWQGSAVVVSMARAVLLFLSFMAMRSSIMRKTNRYFMRQLVWHGLPYVAVKVMMSLGLQPGITRVLLELLLDLALLFFADSRFTAPVLARVPVNVVRMVFSHAPLFVVLVGGVYGGEYVLGTVAPQSLILLWLVGTTLWYAVYAAFLTTLYIRCVYEDTKAYFPVA